MSHGQNSCTEVKQGLCRIFITTPAGLLQGVLTMAQMPSGQLSGNVLVAVVQYTPVGLTLLRPKSGGAETASTMKWIRRAPLSALWAGEKGKAGSLEDRLKSFMRGPFDIIIGGIVILNISFMILLTEWNGSLIDQNLGLAEPSSSWVSESFFSVTEYIFFVIFLLDVVAKVTILRHEWYYTQREGVMYLNLFDAALVLVNFFELILLPAILQGEAQELRINHVRVIKLLRMGRTLRIVKTLSIFLPLRVLVGTCVASLGAFFWSIILLLVLKVTFALIVSQSLQSWLLDESHDLQARKDIHAMYGSFFRATYTMFEITYSGRRLCNLLTSCGAVCLMLGPCTCCFS